MRFVLAPQQISQQSCCSHRPECPRAGVRRSAVEQKAKGLWKYALLKVAGVLEKMFAGAVQPSRVPGTDEIKSIGSGS